MYIQLYRLKLIDTICELFSSTLYQYPITMISIHNHSLNIHSIHILTIPIISFKPYSEFQLQRFKRTPSRLNT